MRSARVSLVIIIENRDNRLNDDRPGIQAGIDEMHRAAGKAGAVFKCLALDVQTRKCWQQGRMDIHDAPGKSLQKVPREQAHEAGQADQFHPGFLQGGDYRRFEALPARRTADGR